MRLPHESSLALTIALGLFFQLCLLIAIGSLHAFRYQRKGTPGRCWTCGYSLEGLGRSATCPECGRTAADVPDPPRQLAFLSRLDPIPILVADLLIMLAATGMESLVAPLLAFKAHGLGYAWDVSWRYANYQASQPRHGLVFSSLSWLIGAIPLFSLLPGKRRRIQFVALSVALPTLLVLFGL